MTTTLHRTGNKYSITDDGRTLVDSCTQNTLNKIIARDPESRKYKSFRDTVDAIDDLEMADVLSAVTTQLADFNAPENQWYNIASVEIRLRNNWIYIEAYKQWYDYKDGYYYEIGELTVMAVLKTYIDRHQIDINQLNTLLQIMKINCNVDYTKINNHPHYINVKNGVLDTINKKLYPHSPDYYYTYQMDVEYLETPLPTPTWDKFCTETVATPEDAEMIKIFLNGVFLGRRSNEFMLWLVGQPNSGKSTLLTILKYIFKNAGLTTTSMSSLGGSFGLQNISTGYINSDDDIIEDAFGNATVSIFKKLLDEDSSVDVNKKHAKQVSMSWKGFLMGASNNLPEFGRNTDKAAIFKRVAFIHFPNQYANNASFKAGLKAELNSIFTNIINRPFQMVKTDIAGWIKKNAVFYAAQTNTLARVIRDKYEYRTHLTHTNFKTSVQQVYGYIQTVYRDEGKTLIGNWKELVTNEINMMGGEKFKDNGRDYFLYIAEKELI